MLVRHAVVVQHPGLVEAVPHLRKCNCNREQYRTTSRELVSPLSCRNRRPIKCTRRGSHQLCAHAHYLSFLKFSPAPSKTLASVLLQFCVAFTALVSIGLVSLAPLSSPAASVAAAPPSLCFGSASGAETFCLEFSTVEQQNTC